MITRPDIRLGDSYIAKVRREIILDSFNKAVANGDKKVYFIDGGKFFEGLNADECTVDGTHPNDLGFARMAEIIGELLKKVLF